MQVQITRVTPSPTPPPPLPPKQPGGRRADIIDDFEGEDEEDEEEEVEAVPVKASSYDHFWLLVDIHKNLCTYSSQGILTLEATNGNVHVVKNEYKVGRSHFIFSDTAVIWSLTPPD